MVRFEERRESLVFMTASPAIWAAHFMACYGTAAVWCAKQATALAPLGAVRAAIVVYTVLALGGIGVVGWVGYRAHAVAAPAPHDADLPEDRHAFMGLATLLLSGLSALAVVYAALVAVFFETCQ